MSTLNGHYRVTRHIVSSVYELFRTLLVTHRRARRLAIYNPSLVRTQTVPVPW